MTTTDALRRSRHRRRRVGRHRGLTGEIEQVPSKVSAIKINGKRSYKRVREGEDVEIPARPVTVLRFEVRRDAARGRLSSTSTSRRRARRYVHPRPRPRPGRRPRRRRPSDRAAPHPGRPVRAGRGAHAGPAHRDGRPGRRGPAGAADRRRRPGAFPRCDVDEAAAPVLSHGGPLPGDRRPARSRSSGRTAGSSRSSRTGARPRRRSPSSSDAGYRERFSMVSPSTTSKPALR